jgi:hypothetical protein
MESMGRSPGAAARSLRSFDLTGPAVREWSEAAERDSGGRRTAA